MFWYNSNYSERNHQALARKLLLNKRWPIPKFTVAQVENRLMTGSPMVTCIILTGASATYVLETAIRLMAYNFITKMKRQIIKRPINSMEHLEVTVNMRTLPQESVSMEFKWVFKKMSFLALFSTWPMAREREPLILEIIMLVKRRLSISKMDVSRAFSADLVNF